MKREGYKIMAKEYKETIKFFGLDGKKYTFKTMQNIASSAQMWWIEPDISMYGGTKRDARGISNEIKQNCKVVEVLDTCAYMEKTIW